MSITIFAFVDRNFKTEQDEPRKTPPRPARDLTAEMLDHMYVRQLDHIFFEEDM